MQRISDYELELMKIIWACGGTAVYAEIAQALEERGTPRTKNTIITLLSRLVDKGYLERSKIGLHRNRYAALIPETEYQTEQTQSLIDKVYEGSVKGLVSALIRKDMLSAADYEELKNHWEAGK